MPVSISEEEVEVLSHLVSSGISLHGKVKSVVSSVDLLSFIASELPLHYLSSSLVALVQVTQLTIPFDVRLYGWAL